VEVKEMHVTEIVMPKKDMSKNVTKTEVVIVETHRDV
jgi:hypothetical protein